ncbi:hypothetical protein [Candidatus Wolbachia massiliensis]|uniref:Uncharacterized protein n=1 Tax=Candidatus Wolbachia massiliensis TaxID=1845000 RepID=A0A7L7YQA6_9RICK|nr:hypothetical protein [Candidatus Wolbachia massiliensis]QOD38209.1 hypothetical protein ID128_05455 [Candidatus Wolbachia massiliensis]
MTDLINFFHENNFFEEGINYTMCIGDNCMDATGKLITHCCVSEVPHSHISHSHEYILSNGAIRTKSVDGKDKITFKANYENSPLSQQTITVSIQKNKQLGI